MAKKWLQPKTLRELAALAAQAEQEASGGEGYACPRCGCKDWRGEANSQVDATRQPVGAPVTVRKRICRHCGQHRFETVEVVLPKGSKVAIIPPEEPERRSGK